MMGKTHLFVGAATALAFTRPDTPEGCVTAMIGGALGGIISDIDMHDNRTKKDALYARMFVLGLIAVTLLTGKGEPNGIVAEFSSSLDRTTVMGAGLFILLCIFGVLQPHRKFTHSVIAAAAYSASVGMMYMPLCIPFAAGIVSHIAIDMLNKKKLQLFWPLKTGVGFNLCYSNKLADKLFLIAGVAATVYFAGMPLFIAYKDEIMQLLDKF